MRTLSAFLPLIGTAVGALGVLSCSDQEGLGVSANRLVNGTEMTTNTFGHIHVTVTDLGGNQVGCSGGLFRIVDQQAVLTAAHCLNGGTPDSPASMPFSTSLEFLDATAQAHERRLAKAILVHPAFVGPLPTRRLNAAHGTGMDLALVFPETQFPAVRPVPEIAGTPASSVLQQDVTIVGAGSSPVGFMRSTVADLQPVIQIGRSTRSVGTLLRAPPGQNPQTGLSQTIESGDSGGPWLRNINGAETLVGATQSDSIFTSGPNAGRASAIAMSLIDDLVWVQFALEVADKAGTVLEAPLDGGLLDQVFVSNRQGIDAILVVTGEGRRVQTSSPRPATFELGEFHGMAIGRFDGAQPKTDPRDLLGVVSGNLVAISNPIGTPSTQAFASSTLQPYRWALVKKCNSDQWDDVVAFLPDSGGLAPTVDVYYGSANGLVGPNTDLSARQCVFVSPNPVQSSSLQGSCRAGSDVLATTCGARLGESGCWCTANCGDAAHPCCDDVATVCGSGAGFEADSAVATVIDQETNPWTEGGFVQPPPVFAVELPDALAPTALAFPLTPEWLLTSTAGQQPEGLTFGGEAISGFSTLAHPDGDLALIHLAPGSAVAAEAAGLNDASVSMFEGTPDVLEQSTGSFVAMAEANDGQVVPVTMSASAMVVSPQPAATRTRRIDPGSMAPGLEEPDSQDAALFGTESASLALLQVPEPSPAFHLLPGSPVFTSLRELVGVTQRSQSSTLGLIDAVAGDVTGDHTVEYLVHRQAPLYRTNAQPDDLTPSPRYWIQQTITRSLARDTSGDRAQDLFVGEVTPASGGGSALFMRDRPLHGSVSSDPASFQAAAAGSPCDWELVGRAKLGKTAMGAVWTCPDSGELQIWRMTGSLVDAVVRGTVPPTWRASALGDIDGDDIADLIWTNSTTGRGFYWIMEPIDRADFTVDRLEGASDPTFLVREFNHFPTQRLLDDRGAPQFELVAADHFDVPSEQRITNPVLGPEQAAADLLWNEIGSSQPLIWPMTYLFRTCDEIDDLITNERCESLGVGALRTYELARNERAVQMDADEQEGLRATGTGDFNDDGRVDIVMHNRGTGPARGEIEIAFGQVDGTFSRQLVTDSGGVPIFENPDFRQIR